MNTPTRYQVAIWHTDGRLLVLGYTARKSIYGVEAIAGAPNAARLAREFSGLAGNTQWDRLKLLHGRGYAYAGWRIGFTGKTEKSR